MGPKRTLLVGVTAAFLGITAAVVVASTNPGGEPATTITATEATEAPVTSQPPVTTVDPEQLAAFAVLAKPAAPAPDATARSRILGRVGANILLTRQAMASTGGTLFVTPGRDAICLGNGRLNTCGPLAGAIRGEVLIVEVCGPELAQGHMRVFGLVPNGVSEVELSTATASEIVSVRDNVYAYEAAGPLVSASFGDGRTPRHDMPLPVPPGRNCEQK